MLTAADLNAEFNNILNNPVSLISNAVSLTAGDILIASTDAAPVLKRLAAGSPTQVLGMTSSNALPAWTGPPVGSRVSGLFGSFSSQIGSFSARQYMMQTTDGRQAFQVNATSSFNVNVGTSGPVAGGRDVAGAFASTFVHFYAITTGANSTAPAGIASTVPPIVGPTMPTSYSAWAYLGADAYTSSSTTIFAGFLSGNVTQYRAPANDAVILSSGASTSPTQVVFSSLVPTNAVRMDAEIAVLVTTAAGTVGQSFFNVTSSLSGSADAMHIIQVTAQVASQEARSGYNQYTFPMLAASSQGLYYMNTSTAVVTFINILSFSNPNGGE